MTTLPNPRLQKVIDQLRLYEHPLLVFDAREQGDNVEVIINFRNPAVPVHTYYFSMHPRDLDHPQFEWTFQHQLFACLHDYLIEMFVRTPQTQKADARPSAGRGHRQLTLREYIEREIGERGPIPFSRYMELCLCGAPGGDPPGFYSRAREQFGKAGDFYTSSDVHAVFGRLLARQFDEMWRTLDSPARIDLVELGPGRGLFAQDVLDWTAKKFPDFHRALHSTLVEASPGLRARLEERFAAQIAAGKVKVVETVEKARIESRFLVFANEFFDALPVEVIADRGELRIGVENGRFVETFAPPSSAELEFLDRYSVHPEPGERVETTLVSLDHLRRVSAALAADARGFCLLVDYGYTRQEQLAGRHRDTVMAFRQHTVSQNPYEAPGEQDITAHVNFTALMEVGKQAGLAPLALVTQSQLLMGVGEDNQFADAFEDCRLPQERAKVALQLKHLATPAGMGDAFQALLLGRGVTKEAAKGLSGLKFARDL